MARENGFDTYKVLGSDYILANHFRSQQNINPGIYRIKVIPRTAELLLQAISITSDKLVDLPDTVSDKVLSEIDDFFTEETRSLFEKYEFLYKRGILLYGEPGTGKTVIVHKIMDKLVGRGGIVLLNPDPYNVNAFVTGIRDVEPDKQVLIVWEDLDAMLDEHEIEILAVLDGEDRMDNVVFIATTNYITQIPMRISNRPSRFASVIEVGLPGPAARKMFLEAKLHKDDNVNLDEWVKVTEGLTIDHLKDLIISVMCLKLPLESAAEKLRSMGPVDPQDEDHDDEYG